jgi:O-antigen/teichoic acid export membrane protein
MGQVKRDSIINTIITYSGIGIGYLNKGLLFPLLLLPEQVGLVNVVMLIVGFFGQLSNLGTGMIIMRFLPLMKGKEVGYSGLLFLSSILLMGGIGFISLSLLLFKSSILGYFSERSPLLIEHSIWIIPLGISGAFFSLFENYLRSISKNIVSVLIQDFFLRLAVLSGLALYYFGWIDFNQFIVLFFALQFIPGFFISLYLFYLKQFFISRRYYSIGRKLRNYMIGYGMIVYVNSFGRNVILMADTLMLSSISGLKEVGIFTTMVFLSNALFVPYVSILRISAPFVPKFWKKRDMVSLSSLYKRISSLGFFITFILFSIVWFNIDIVLSFLPQEYDKGKYIFLLLMLGRMFDALGGINGDILLTSKRFKTEVWLTIPLVFIVFILNFYVIPQYGGIGAAAVTCMVYFIYNFLRIMFNFLYFRLLPFDRSFFKILFFAAVMFVSGTLLNDFVNGLLQVICLTALPIAFFAFPVYKLDLNNDVTVFVDGLLKRLKLKGD